MRQIGLTGWEIFSKLDAIKSTLNQAEDISPRVFRLLKGLSIPESNQRGKRNKNHMNPLIQLKKATPLFVIALVLACFALSPQAFAAPTPTFSPASNWSGCQNWKWVTISSGPPGGWIFVKTGGQVGGWIPNPGWYKVGYLGTKTLCAFHSSNKSTPDSGWGYSTYTCNCPTHQWDCK
jgi:hypothetical protein